MDRTERRKQNGRLAGAVLLVVLVLVGGFGAWELAGGKLYVMSTSSMCPRICVGSAVFDMPAPRQFHKGELISFHPPGASDGVVYTHAVWDVLPDGKLQTKGDQDPKPDPWALAPTAVVGRVAFSIWGLGWLLRALPVVCVGCACWVIGRRIVGRATRRTWDRACLTAIAVVPSLSLHPLIRGQVVSDAVPVMGTGFERARVINTGLMPATFQAATGLPTRVVRPGSAVEVWGTGSGPLTIHEKIAMPTLGWAALALLVCSPLLGYLWHILRNDEVSPVEVAPVAVPGLMAASAPSDGSSSQPAQVFAVPRHFAPKRRSRAQIRAQWQSPRQAA